MLSHLSLGVADIHRSAIFYDAVLGALGYVRLWTGEDGLGYGNPGGGEALNLFLYNGDINPPPRFHVAFRAPDRSTVDLFHAAGLRTGGTDAGGPNFRPHYGATYYAAFLNDLDGYKIEAVHQ